MNFILQIKRKYFFIILIFLFILTILFIFFEKDRIIQAKSYEKQIKSKSKYDIINPKFSMNNLKEKIIISANEGNFINDSKILLKKNVIFKSDEFQISSEDVYYDKKKQTAESNKRAVFKAKNTSIISEGFKIGDEGEKINFNGKTKLVLTNE